MGYGLEIDMIKIAHDLDLLTSPYVFDVDQAKDMARAGSDILVPHHNRIGSALDVGHVQTGQVRASQRGQ